MIKNKKTSIVSLSGGLDSTVMLYDKVKEIGLAVTFDYGQLTAEKEIELSKWHCDNLGIEHQVIDLKYITGNFTSKILKDSSVKEEDDLQKLDNYVPFRNGIILSILTGLAYSKGLSKILYARHCNDKMPDMSEKFISHLSKAINLGSRKQVKLATPYKNLSKADLIRIGMACGLDFDKTWTCYHNGSEPCGECSACKTRQVAFEEVQKNSGI